MTPQQIQLQLLKLCPKFNNNADDIIRSLIDNEPYWDSMIVDNDLMVKLRDLGTGIWNADTIYIMTHHRDVMEPVVESWNPSAWEWISNPDDFLGGADVDCQVVKVWFD
jgi:hypothetical protein